MPMPMRPLPAALQVGNSRHMDLLMLLDIVHVGTMVFGLWPRPAMLSPGKDEVFHVFD